ncbi:hypothetical protein HXT04_10580 [Treponema parvum]|nr:hypothetical protein HXT04_10580 [Treponema parvum]
MILQILRLPPVKAEVLSFKGFVPCGFFADFPRHCILGGGTWTKSTTVYGG